MGLALFAFMAIFLLIGSAGLLVFYRAEMMQRLSAAIRSGYELGAGEPVETEPGRRIHQGGRPAIR